MVRQLRFLKRIAGLVLHYISRARVRIAPNFFTRAEQFWNEMGIEGMQKHSGYAAFAAILRSRIPTGVRVLDLGCNKGFETNIIGKTNPVVGVDAYASFVKVASKRGVDARVMDFHNLKFSQEFDCVYSNNSLEHAKFPEKVVQGVFRALKPGGLFIVGMPLDGNNPKTKDPAHFFRATAQDAISLLEKNGFAITHQEVIDTKVRWNWENQPANNQMLICVAKKS